MNAEQYSAYSLQESGTENPARLLAKSRTIRIGMAVLLSVMLGIILGQSEIIATGHTLLVFGLGLLWLVRDENSSRVIYVVAYIVGAELLWRSTGSAVFWEFSKYAATLLLLLSLLKETRLLRTSKAPIIYFVLLLPSIALLPGFDRDAISFNLSGPLLLAVAVMYFGNQVLSERQLRRLLLALILPIISFAALAMFLTISADVLTFGSQSVSGRVTSAGFGPNQASSILGLGMFIAFVVALLETKSSFLRVLFFMLAIWLAVQAALTFSRGGIWAGAGALAVGTLYWARDRRTRTLLFAGILVTSIIAYFVAVPFLDSLTQGFLITRFQDADLTGRDLIIQADLFAFRQNLLFGVGPGQSEQWHSLTFRASNAHTEYTRLLAEHGLFGLGSLLILLGTASFRGLRSYPSRAGKAVVLAMTVWALLHMVHAGMRVAAPGFMFGLAAVIVYLGIPHGQVLTKDNELIKPESVIDL
ncbi:MAG: O-antigen ligase family protein [Anaerolineae bacterium]|nr:O-antigen ligase family protein [Anaerolineae bacterium]MCO5187155.1 O-antigen ligase family protein [Anaerolineae bacterium]MCO5207397.1 O-antigen ligase family protein [Anaerolineae bacterium]